MMNTTDTGTPEERREINIGILRGLEAGATYRRIKSLPALDDLLILKKKDPEGLYKAAVKLRVDREQLENDVLVPLRRAVAEVINLRSIMIDGEPLFDDDHYATINQEHWQQNAIAGLLSQMMHTELALLKYESKDTMDRLGLTPDTDTNA